MKSWFQVKSEASQRLNEFFRSFTGLLRVPVRRQSRSDGAWLRPPRELRSFVKMWLHACSHLQSILYDSILDSW